MSRPLEVEAESVGLKADEVESIATDYQFHMLLAKDYGPDEWNIWQERERWLTNEEWGLTRDQGRLVSKFSRAALIEFAADLDNICASGGSLHE